MPTKLTRKSHCRGQQDSVDPSQTARGELAVAMSWFERRQQAAKLEAEAEPAVVSVLDTAPEPRAAGGAAACSAADDAAYVATQRAAADAPLFDEDACATRVLSCDSEQGARTCANHPTGC